MVTTVVYSQHKIIGIAAAIKDTPGNVCRGAIKIGLQIGDLGPDLGNQETEIVAYMLRKFHYQSMVPGYTGPAYSLESARYGASDLG